jgi:hypothetical protein
MKFHPGEIVEARRTPGEDAPWYRAKIVSVAAGGGVRVTFPLREGWDGELPQQQIRAVGGGGGGGGSSATTPRRSAAHTAGRWRGSSSGHLPVRSSSNRPAVGGGDTISRGAATDNFKAGGDTVESDLAWTVELTKRLKQRLDQREDEWRSREERWSRELSEAVNFGRALREDFERERDASARRAEEVRQRQFEQEELARRVDEEVRVAAEQLDEVRGDVDAHREVFEQVTKPLQDMCDNSEAELHRVEQALEGERISSCMRGSGDMRTLG